MTNYINSEQSSNKALNPSGNMFEIMNDENIESMEMTQTKHMNMTKRNQVPKMEGSMSTRKTMIKVSQLKRFNMTKAKQKDKMKHNLNNDHNDGYWL